jgi:hypothetical protein
MNPDKDKTLEEFLKNLKKTFNITCLFSKEHPLFIKAIEDFKKTLDPAFVLINPIKIGVTPDSFVIEGKYFSGDLIYGEMAKMFHLRRIQNIQISEGITVAELATLFQVLAMHHKEIMANGGIKRIFSTAHATHIAVEELDYSQLLKGSGAECKDVWMYLLKEAVDREDAVKVETLADNFDKMVQHFHLNEILENEELKENIHQFITYLRAKGKDKFSLCAKGMATAILKEKNIPKELDIDKIRVFFEGLTDKDFADILGQGLSTDQGFNPLSFALFSKILNEEKHRNIAALTAKSLESQPFKDRDKLAKNMEKLFSDSATSAVSKVYQSTLSSILNDISFKDTRVFDPALTYRNYHFLLLNLFSEEENRERLSLILEKLNSELDKIIQNKDLEFLMFLIEGIRKKRTQDPALADLFDGLEKKIYNFIEQDICEQKITSGLEFFLDNMHASTLGLDFYLRSIFSEDKLNPNLMKLFLKFFPDQLDIFKQLLDQELNDIEFLERLFESLTDINEPSVLEILKYIYPLVNNFVKVEVLKTMQKFTIHDTEFLLAILRGGEFSLKKEALITLMKDEEARQKVTQALFNIRSHWGTKNNIILENIIVVEDAGFKAARDYLVAISKRHFFWNNNIRKEALRILKKWTR